MNSINDNNLVFILDKYKNIQFFPAKRCLIGNSGNVIELSENGSRFLFLLLLGETDKQTLINRTWEEQKGAVSESSYYGQIYLLRKAFHSIGLSDDLIKTLPRKGVKYMGEVQQTLLSDSKEKSIEGGELSTEIEPTNSNTAIFSIPQGTDGIIERKQYFVQEDNNKNDKKEWYYSKSWNIFVSSLAVLAICWLLTLLVGILFLLKLNH